MSYKVNNKKIAKNTIALYIRMGFTMLVSFWTTRITLQVLGVNDFGLNNLVSGIVSLFSFLNASLGTAVQRFYSIEIGKNNIEKLKKTFGCALSMHFIVAIFTSLLIELFALLFLDQLNIPIERQSAAKIVFQISILSLFINIVSVPYSAMLRAREMFSKIATMDILQSLLRLIIIYILTIINYDKLVSLSLLNLLVSFIYVGLTLYISYRDEACKTGLCWDIKIIKSMIKFISMLIITVFALLVRDKGIILLINLYFNLAINAAYAVAMQVMTMTNTFVANFKQSLVPQMVASYGYGDITTMHRLINIGTKMTFILMLTVSVPIIFESNYLLELWLKTPPENTSGLIKLVLINVNISSFTYFLYQGVHATGNITRQQTAYSIMYIINIILIVILFELGFNYLTALYVTILTSIVQCAINIYYAKKTFSYDIETFVTSIIPRCLTAVSIHVIIMYLVTNHLCEESIYRLILTIIISIIISTSTGLYIIFDRPERKYVINKLIKLKK